MIIQVLTEDKYVTISAPIEREVLTATTGTFQGTQVVVLDAGQNPPIPPASNTIYLQRLV